jgi:hypothetical protein
MNSRLSKHLKETQTTNPKTTFPWLKFWLEQTRRPRMASLGFICLLVALGVLGLSLAGRRAGAAQTDISGPAGSGSFGTQAVVLPNGNIVVTDPN